MNSIYKFWKQIILSIVLLAASSVLIAESADEAIAKNIAETLRTVSIPSGVLYRVSEADLETLLAAADKQGITMFELLDYTYRYLASGNYRIEVSGDLLRKLNSRFSYGDAFAMAVLPIQLLDNFRLGVPLFSGDHAFDAQLKEAYTKEVPIKGSITATILYDKTFSLIEFEPSLFKKSEGMHIKLWVIKKAIRKIDLYEPRSVAVYVNHFPTPKRWSFDPIMRIGQ